MHEKIQVQDFRNWVSSSSEGTSRSAPESPIIGLIETPAASLPVQTQLKSQASQPLKHLNILQLLLKEPPMLVGLEVMGLKGRKVLPFDWYLSSLCLSQPRKNWERNYLMILC